MWYVGVLVQEWDSYTLVVIRVNQTHAWKSDKVQVRHGNQDRNESPISATMEIQIGQHGLPLLAIS